MRLIFVMLGLLVFGLRANELVSFQTLLADAYQHENVMVEKHPKGLKIHLKANQSGFIQFNAGEQHWDLTQSKYLSIELENNTNVETRFEPTILITEAPNSGKQFTAHIGFIRPHENLVFNNVLFRHSKTSTDYPHKTQFPGMRGLPGGAIINWDGIDAKKITGLRIDFPAQPHVRKLVIKRIFSNGELLPNKYQNDPAAFFPFINDYGQYKHDEWPGKITDDKQFETAIIEEMADLKKHPGSLEWDRFGGLVNGPQFEATGHFRTQKINGKWWIINPDGRLFWSTGVNSAGRLNVLTPLPGREHFFEDLPDNNSANAAFFKGDSFDYGLRNQYRKYGQGSEEKYLHHSLHRMKSWGLNTLGGWSNEAVAAAEQSKKLPYTVFIGSLTPAINSKFPDVFDPRWKQNLEQKIKAKAQLVKDDLYFFGFFINNEIHWGNPFSLAQNTLNKNKRSAGKQQYVSLLKEKLKTIARFNQLTGGSFKSWAELLAQPVKKNALKIGRLTAINERHYRNMVTAYFKISRELIDKHAPGKMYLGCRWHGNHKNAINVAIAAKYVDILTFNAYENEVEHYPFPAKDIDKPFIISEFNFGALDRGKFFTGLGYASSQRNRGEKYRNFVEGALRNPRIVGVHWFMWANSTTAGRGNGENASCGLVSMTDQVYYELIGYMRDINYRLYDYRLSQ